MAAAIEDDGCQRRTRTTLSQVDETQRRAADGGNELRLGVRRELHVQAADGVGLALTTHFLHPAPVVTEALQRLAIVVRAR